MIKLESHNFSVLKTIIKSITYSRFNSQSADFLTLQFLIKYQ